MSFLSHSLSHSTCFVFFTPRAFFPLSLSLSLSFLFTSSSFQSFVCFRPSFSCCFSYLVLLLWKWVPSFPLLHFSLSFCFFLPSLYSSASSPPSSLLARPPPPLPSSKSSNKERDAFFKIQQQRARCLLQNPTRERCLLQNPATKRAMRSSKSNKRAMSSSKSSKRARDISPPLGFLERCPLLFLSRRMASGLVRSALTSAMMSHAVWRNATTTTSTNCIRRSGLGLINTASIMGTQGEDARRGFKTAVNNYNVLYSADSDAAAAKNSAEGTRMEKANTRDTRTHTYMTETTGNGGGGIWTRK